MALMIHFTRDKADKTIPSLEESLSEEQRMQQRWLDDKDNDYGVDVDGSSGDDANEDYDDNDENYDQRDPCKGAEDATEVVR